MRAGVSRLISNTAWNGIGRVVAVSTSVILTPYLLTNLGPEAFGLWAFSRLLLGYLSLLDLGIHGSLVRQIAHALPDTNPDRFSKILSTSFFIFLAAGCAFLPLMAWVTPTLVRAAVEWRPTLLSPDLLDEGVAAITLTASTVLFWISGAVISASLPGVQRMDIANKLGMVWAFLNMAGAIALVEAGYRVPALIAWTLVVRVIDSFIAYKVIRTLYPKLELNTRNVDKAIWLELYSFAWRTQVSRLGELFATTVDRLFVGAFGGAAALGLYHPALQIVNQARLLPPLLVSAMLPYASELSAKQDRKALLRLYFEGTRYLAFGSFALLGFIMAVAELLTAAWLGPGYSDIPLWVQVFCAGYLVSTPMALGGLLSQAMGYPGLQARSSLLMAGSNLILAPLGYVWGGITGLTIGSAVSIALSAVWFFVALHRTIQVSGLEVVRECYLGPAAWLGAASIAVWLGAALWLEAPSGRVEALYRIAVLGLGFSPIVLLAARQLGLLERSIRVVENWFGELHERK